MSGGALRSIFAMFDVSTGNAETKVDKLNNKVTGAREGLVALGGALVGAFSLHAVSKFFGDMIELGSVLNDTSERLGIATDDLQRFQYAAGLSGVNAEEAGRALGFLNKSMGEAIGGSKEQAEMFAGLDIAMKNADGSVRELGDVIPEVADAFAKMGSDQERTAAAMKLFGKSGASLLPLLKNGSAELARLNAQFTELGLGIDDDFIKMADEAGDNVDIMKLGFRALGSTIAHEFLPKITAGAKKVSEWIAKAREFTNETNIAKEGMFALGGAAAFAAAKTAASWGKTLGIFPKNGGVFEKLFSLGKLGLTTIALAGLTGGVEDLVTMCQGGESVIGDFLDEFGEAGAKEELINSLTQAWEDMQLPIEDVARLIGEIGPAVAKSLPYVVGAIADIVKGTFTLANALGLILIELGDLDKADFELMKKDAMEAADRQANIWAGGSTVVNMLKAQSAIPGSAVMPYGPPPPPANVEVNNEFNINGAADPQAVGRRVMSFQRDTYEDAQMRAAANAVASGPE